MVAGKLADLDSNTVRLKISADGADGNIALTADSDSSDINIQQTGVLFLYNTLYFENAFLLSENNKQFDVLKVVTGILFQ